MNRVENIELKVCTKCGEEKPATSEFYYRIKGREDRLVSSCKGCAAEHRKANAGKLSEWQRKYRQENKAMFAERSKIHRQGNKATIAERRKIHYQKNKATLTEKQKKYRQENKAKVAEGAIKYRQENKATVAKRSREYHQKNKITIAEQKKRYRRENNSTIVEQKKRYRQENKDTIAERMRKYQQENKSTIAEQAKRYRREYLFYTTQKANSLFADETMRSPDGYLQVKCINSNCGKRFTPSRNAVTARLRAIRGQGSDGAENHFYCSAQCKQSCMLYNAKAKTLIRLDRISAGSNFNHTDFYSPTDLNIWADQVKTTANNTCEICGSTEDLQAHHIEPKSIAPEIALDPANGICLCKECHYKHGHGDKGCRTTDLRRCEVS